MSEGMAAEAGWADLRHETARLLARARHRPLAVALVTLAIVGAAVTVAARRPARQRATAVLRITEADPTSSPRIGWTDRTLRGYVTEVAFSQTRLLEVIRRQKLFGAGEPGFDPVETVALFRERTTVDVAQNHSIALLPPADRPRSAHVHIGFEARDPTRALAVAVDLGRLVATTGLGQRRNESLATLRRAELAAEEARAELIQIRTELGREEPLAPVKPEAAARVLSLRRALHVAEVRRGRAEDALLRAELRLGSEAAGSGLAIDLLEPAPLPAPLPRSQLLGLVALAAATLGLPLAALGVGALDRRIYGAADLRWLGLCCLGVLPHEPRGSRTHPGASRGSA